MKDLSYLPKMPNTGGWQSRHTRAVIGSFAHILCSDNEHAIGRAIGAWCDYARNHAERFGSPIGQDYVLGPAWARWGFALRELLNGELGRLDGGTLDTILHDNLAEQGYNPDEGAP